MGARCALCLNVFIQVSHSADSGAGKTTCLDVLAQRKNIGVISGDLLVDGRPLTSEFARGTAYG